MSIHISNSNLDYLHPVCLVNRTSNHSLKIPYFNMKLTILLIVYDLDSLVLIQDHILINEYGIFLIFI